MSNSAMQRAVEHVGLKKLAEACSVRYQAVQKWQKYRCPAERVLCVEKATDGLVTRHELRPDIYPRDDMAGEL